MAVIREDLHGPFSYEKVGAGWQILLTPEAHREITADHSDFVPELLNTRYRTRQAVLDAAGVLSNYLHELQVAEKGTRQ